MPPRLKSLLWPAAWTSVACAILVWLGVWQLQRLAWKERLIGEIETRATASPQPLPTIMEWPSLRPNDYEYRRVTLDGTFLNDDEALVYSATSGGAGGGTGPGYFVLTPMQLQSGGYIIVNRGFVPLDRKEQGARKAGLIQGETQITGLLRPPEPRNIFTPVDDPAAGQYFTRDPSLIAAHFGLAPAAPFSIDADNSPVQGGWPKGGTTLLDIPNKHLSYALTWFGMALALLGVFTAFAWQKR
jgi:surfeit locus 1 family protein